MGGLCATSGPGKNTIILLFSVLCVNCAVLYMVRTYYIPTTSYLACQCPEIKSSQDLSLASSRLEHTSVENRAREQKQEKAEEEDDKEKQELPQEKSATEPDHDQQHPQTQKEVEELLDKQKHELEREHQQNLEEELRKQKEQLEQKHEEDIKQKLGEKEEKKQKEWEERTLQDKLKNQIWDQIHLVKDWWELRAGEHSLPKNTTLMESLQRSLFLAQYWSLFKGGKPPLDVTPPSDLSEWWKAAAMIDWFLQCPVTMKCKDYQGMGNWHVCMDPPYAVKPPCLVYSFGIGFDFSFDDAMGDLGCEVHSFDPSMGKEDHNRSERVTFHNLGISGHSSANFTARKDMYVKDKQVWTIKTLDVIMKELGHEGKTLDVLKIDVEGHEWAVVDDLLNKHIMTSQVRHFLLEWHLFADWPDKDSYPKLYETFKRLKDSGFEEYSKYAHPRNLAPDKFNLQGDAEFVNTKFKPR